MRVPNDKTSPTVLDLKSFEKDVIQLLENIKVSRHKKTFSRHFGKRLEEN